MRSLQVLNGVAAGVITDEPAYTDLMVLKSPAGWYIGTLHNYCLPGNERECLETRHLKEPGSRDSTYFETEEIAKEALARLEDCWADKETLEKEDVTPIEAWEMWLVGKGYDPEFVGYRMMP